DADLTGQLGGVVSQVLLVHNAGPVHQERHHAGRTIARRPRDHGESPRHGVTVHVTRGSARGVRSLTLQHLEVVTMVWCAPLGVSLRYRRGHQIADWALVLRIGTRPIQAV